MEDKKNRIDVAEMKLPDTIPIKVNFPTKVEEVEINEPRETVIEKIKKDTEVKEDILRALEGKKILLCPHCKCKAFFRNGYANVEITEEDDSLLDTITNGFERYRYLCSKCGEEVDVDDMIKTAKLVFNGED